MLTDCQSDRNSGKSRLRPYQHQAVVSAISALRTTTSAMIVMATGTGKTVVMSDLARRTHRRVLVLAHRSELVHQAADTMAKLTGKPVGMRNGPAPRLRPADHCGKRPIDRSAPGPL